MEDPRSHTILIDRARKLIEVRLSGALPSPEDASWIGEEVHAAIRSLGADVGQHVTLYDASALQVAPAATIDVTKALFANPAVRPLWAKRVAYVVGSALGRMQAQRLRAARSDIGVFDNRDEALAWLLAD